MDICHLYDSSSSSLKIKEILVSSPNSISLDVSKIQSLEDYSVYIVEAGKIDKNLSAKLKTLLESKPHSLIYFLISKEYNLMLFQTAFLLKAKTVITESQDAKKIILKIKNDFKLHEDEYIHNLLGKSLLQTQHFMLYKNSKLSFASKKLFEDFQSKSLNEIEKKISSQVNIESLLAQDSIMKESITNDSKKDISYHIRSSSTNKKDEKLIFFEPFIKEVSNNKLNFISNRLSFIEFLKDKLVEKSISNKSFSIITLQIENIDKLQSDLSEIELQSLLKEFLLQVEIMLDEKIILAQYDKDFYVTLFEDIDFETLKIKAQNFHNKISTFLKDKKYSPLIGLFVFDINELELNDVLTTLKHIIMRTLTEKEVHNHLQYINNVQLDMDPEEAMRVLLNSTFTNRVEFKLLNIYKGLCVNTSSKIIKKKDDSIYIKFEQLQGILMKNEKETVLQSSNFLKDIKANVKYVDLEKKIAILDKFEFLNTNANARKYSRVTCSTRTPIVISHPAGTINGEILDISVNSIAIKAKYRSLMDKIKHQDVDLTFVLPTKSSEDGFTKLKLKAKAVYLLSDESECKIVCDLYKDDDNEAVFMEYVYNRQKEIIIEVKKMAKFV